MATTRISDLVSPQTASPLVDYIVVPPKPIRSKLRIVAGSDVVTFHYPHPVPNWFVRLMTLVLLRMEWVEVSLLGKQ